MTTHVGGACGYVLNIDGNGEDEVRQQQGE